MAVLSEVAVNIVAAEDETRFHDLMQRHHYPDFRNSGVAKMLTH